MTATKHSSGLQGLPRIDLLGVKFHAVSERACVEAVLAEIAAGRGGWVMTPNLDILRRLGLDRRLRRLSARADLIVADGMPLIWASRLKRTPLPERVAGSNLIHSLSAAAAESGRSLFLLGGDPGTADAAAAVLTERHPGLEIRGTLCPAPGFEKDPKALRAMADHLVEARPDIVYVALGCPKQDRLIACLRDLLPATWWLGVGISFSFVCGRVQRSPTWMQRSGLEWAHRLRQEPARLARRYLLEDLPFAAHLFFQSAFRRLLPAKPEALSQEGGRS
jgi:N-acetylglucosaminyldiphosphoundecaprenol N-acetyl-beta-D-mannosaminyltransferase